MKKRGLGRSLGAILSTPAVSEIKPQSAEKDEKNQIVKPEIKQASTHSIDQKSTQTSTEASSNSYLFKELAVGELQRGKYQPRRDMDDEALAELAQSIKAQGILQPIIVRALPNDGTTQHSPYEIIAGERRWRAAQQAGLSTVPVVIKPITDETAMAIGLVENLQRENLNPIEEAMALDRLSKEFNLTHQEVAESVGRSRTAVSNLLRLLNLVAAVRMLLQHGDIEMGHARALLALPEDKQLSTAKYVIEKNLSVRETEELVKRVLHPKQASSALKPMAPALLEKQQQLATQLGQKVHIQQKTNGKGKLVIAFDSQAQLDTVLAYFS